MSPYIAGRNAVLEALKAGRRVRRLLVDAGASPSARLQAVIDAARAAGVPVARIPASRLMDIHPRHQGVAAEVLPFPYASFEQVEERIRAAGSDTLVLVLDELQDPQNVGSLLRTALAVNVTAVLIPRRRAAGITPAAVRASAGAAEHLCLCQVPNLVRSLEDLKRLGVWVVGLDVRGGTPLYEADLPGPVAIVVGSEGSGLGRLVRAHCDLLVHLPMAGPTESLNAAVAGSIALYHLFRQRRAQMLTTG